MEGEAPQPKAMTMNGRPRNKQRIRMVNECSKHSKSHQQPNQRKTYSPVFALGLFAGSGGAFIWPVLASVESLSLAPHPASPNKIPITALRLTLAFTILMNDLINCNSILS